MENLMPFWLAVLLLVGSVGAAFGVRHLLDQVRAHHLSQRGRLDHPHSKWATAYAALLLLNAIVYGGVGYSSVAIALYACQHFQ